MVKVYNPIYDTVFKYLMEDDKAAKVLLGSILDKKIKVLSIDEFKDSSDDYKTLITRLYKATVDEDMRGKIEFEEEMERKFKRIRYERAELTDALNEAKGMIADQHKQIEEKDKALAAKDNQLAASIKMLSSFGASFDQIAAQLNISIDEVKKVLGK